MEAWGLLHNITWFFSSETKGEGQMAIGREVLRQVLQAGLRADPDRAVKTLFASRVYFTRNLVVAETSVNPLNWIRNCMEGTFR